MKPKLVWDAHGCFPLKVDSDLTDLKRYKKAGVDVLSINVGMDYNSLAEVTQVIARFRNYISQQKDYVLAATVNDIKKAKSKNKMAITFDLEGSVMCQDNPNMISFFYDLGVRQMLLAYNKDNSISGGCMGENKGLTSIGRKFVKEMNRVGMTIDVSHMSHKASMECLDLSTKPVIFSHSNAKALCTHPRNITDDQIKACAKQKGVIGINGIGSFLSADADTSTPKLVEHIDHMVQLVGPEHVGIGLDFVVDEQELWDFLNNNPEYYKHDSVEAKKILKYSKPEQIKEIPTHLKKRGYSSKAIDQIMGGNFHRVAKANWSA